MRVLSAAVVLAAFMALASASWIATFDNEHVKGTIVFSYAPAGDDAVVTTDISYLSPALTGKALWHIHEFPAGSNSTDCGPSVVGGHWDPYFKGMTSKDEIGNLSGRHGKLQKGKYSAVDALLYSFDGYEGSVNGRSIVIHVEDGASNPRVTCASIVVNDPAASPQVARVAIANFPENPRATFSMLPRMVNLPGQLPYQAYIQAALNVPETSDVAGGSLYVSTMSCSDSDTVTYTSLLDVALDLKKGDNNIYFTETTYGYDYYISRGLVLTNSSGDVVACADFAAASVTKPYGDGKRDYSAPVYSSVINHPSVNVTVTFQQVADDQVLILVQKPSLEYVLFPNQALWHIHEFGMRTKDAGCAPGVVGGHWDPTFKGQSSPEETGNLSGRHGKMWTGMAAAYTDFGITSSADKLTDVTGALGIVGRSVVVHAHNPAAGNPRIACALISDGAEVSNNYVRPLIAPVPAAAASSLQVVFAPRLAQVYGADHSYLQFQMNPAKDSICDGAKVYISSTNVDAPSIPFDDEIYELKYSDTASNGFLGVLGRMDGLLGRSLIVVAKDGSRFVWPLLSQDGTEVARNWAAPLHSSEIDVDYKGDDLEGVISFQELDIGSVTISAAFEEVPDDFPADGVKFAIYDGSIADKKSDCSKAGNLWNPTDAATGTADVVGDLSARHGNLASSWQFYKDELLSKHTFIGLTLVLIDAATDAKISCTPIGNSVTTANADLGDGSIVTLKQGKPTSEGVVTTKITFKSDAVGGKMVIYRYNDLSSSKCPTFDPDIDTFAPFGFPLEATAEDDKKIDTDVNVNIPVSVLLGRTVFLFKKDGSAAGCAVISADGVTTPKRGKKDLIVASARMLPHKTSDESDIPPMTFMSFEQSTTGNDVTVFMHVDATNAAEFGDDDKLAWHVHNLPAPFFNEDKTHVDCDAMGRFLDNTFADAAGAQQAGNLGARHGLFTKKFYTKDTKIAQRTFTDRAISLRPDRINIIGRGIALHHGDHTHWTCGNIFLNGVEPTKLPRGAQLIIEPEEEDHHNKAGVNVLGDASAATSFRLTHHEDGHAGMNVVMLQPNTDGYTPSLIAKATFGLEGLAGGRSLLISEFAIPEKTSSGVEKCGTHAAGRPVIDSKGKPLNLLSFLNAVPHNSDHVAHDASVSLRHHDEDHDDEQEYAAVNGTTIVAGTALISDTLDFVDKFAGHTVVLRTSAGALACARIPGADGTPAPADLPVDRNAAVVRVFLKDTVAKKPSQQQYVNRHIISFVAGSIRTLLEDDTAAQNYKILPGAQAIVSDVNTASTVVPFAVNPFALLDAEEEEFSSFTETIRHHDDDHDAEPGVVLTFLTVPDADSSVEAAGKKVVDALKSEDGKAQMKLALHKKRFTVADTTSEAVASVSGLCLDGKANYGETDVDCGNSRVTFCPPCDARLKCREDNDCLSRQCKKGVCQVGKSNSASGLVATTSVAFLAIAASLFFILF